LVPGAITQELQLFGGDQVLLQRVIPTAGYGRLLQGTAYMLCSMIDGVEFKGLDFSAPSERNV
jgi:hypothetical protein